MRDLVIVGTVGLLIVGGLLVSQGGGESPKLQTVFEHVEYRLAEWRQAEQNRETDAWCAEYWAQKAKQDAAAATTSSQ